MGQFLQRTINGVRSFIDAYREPDSAVVGGSFEKYVKEWMFPEDGYLLLHHTGSYQENSRRFAEETLLPDFRFRCFETKKDFFVECKFRREGGSSIEWCKDYQYQRYLEVNKDVPVFVVLGVGGSGLLPQDVYLFPVDRMRYNYVYNTYLENFRFPVDRPVFSKYLWGLRK